MKKTVLTSCPGCGSLVLLLGKGECRNCGAAFLSEDAVVLLVAQRQKLTRQARASKMSRRGYTKGKGIDPEIGASIADRIAWRQIRKLRELDGKALARRPFVDLEQEK